MHQHVIHNSTTSPCWHDLYLPSEVIEVLDTWPSQQLKHAPTYDQTRLLLQLLVLAVKKNKE